MKVDSQDIAGVPVKVLRLREVLRKTGLSRSTLYNRITDGQFPRQISLGNRAIGWLEAEVDTWISDRVRFSRHTPVGCSRCQRAASERWALPEK